MNEDQLTAIELGTLEGPAEPDVSRCVSVTYALAGKDHHQRWKRACITSSVLLMGIVAALLVVLVLFLVSTSPEITTVVEHSTEYQAVIFPEDWQCPENRIRALETYLEKVNESMGTALTVEDGTTNIRSQFYYSLNGGHRCGSSYDIRVREYLEGPNAGTRYMDMKAGSHIKSFACSNPIWPTQESPMGLLRIDKSRIKCERDVHACDGKYSMSSRVFFDESLAELPMLATCNDVKLFYPWSLPGTTEAQRFHPVTENIKVHYWWVWSYDGYVEDGGDCSRINIDATLEYDSLEDAKSAKVEPGHSSEFSLKVFEGTNGYDTTVQDNAESLHRSILETWGSRGQYEEGVCL